MDGTPCLHPETPAVQWFITRNNLAINSVRFNPTDASIGERVSSVCESQSLSVEIADGLPRAPNGLLRVAPQALASRRPCARTMPFSLDHRLHLNASDRLSASIMPRPVEEHAAPGRRKRRRNERETALASSRLRQDSAARYPRAPSWHTRPRARTSTRLPASHGDQYLHDPDQRTP